MSHTELGAFRALVRIAKTNGAVAFRLHEGEDWACEKTDNENTLADNVNSTGGDHLHCYDIDGRRLAFFYLIWNNGNVDELIADMSGNDWAEKVWNDWKAKIAA